MESVGDILCTSRYRLILDMSDICNQIEKIVVSSSISSDVPSNTGALRCHISDYATGLAKIACITVSMSNPSEGPIRGELLANISDTVRKGLVNSLNEYGICKLISTTIEMCGYIANEVSLNKIPLNLSVVACERVYPDYSIALRISEYD